MYKNLWVYVSKIYNDNNKNESLKKIRKII